MSGRKYNAPFRAAGTSLADALREYAGDCHCDEPEPGESGVIVCTNCALLSFADEAEAADLELRGALSEIRALRDDLPLKDTAAVHQRFLAASRGVRAAIVALRGAK